MEVRKIMTKNPACCTPDSTIQEVAHMMEMYDCGCIPVVEDHKTNKPIGTITDRDIAIRALATGGNPADMKASDIMTTDIATVAPETTVEQCRDEMEERQIRRILVVDKTGRCVGIVAQADVVQNETNPQQTAEFIRDISSASSGSQPQYGGGSASMNQFGVRDREMSGAVSSDRESYRNFSNQSDDYEQSFSSGRSGRAFAKNDKKRKKIHRKEKSFFSFSSILPLLIGVGAGAALKFYLQVDQKSQTTFVPRGEVSTSLHTARETTPKVSIELPTPAKTETATQTRIDMTDSRDTSAPKTRFSPDDDSDVNLEIGRTAKL